MGGSPAGSEAYPGTCCHNGSLESPDQASDRRKSQSTQPRESGIARIYIVEVMGKQLRSAEKQGIPFVLFPGDGVTELRDSRSGERTRIVSS